MADFFYGHDFPVMTVHAGIDTASSCSEAHHFAHIAPDNGKGQPCCQLQCALRPVRRTTGTYGIQHDGDILLCCRFAGPFHRIYRPGLKRSHIEDQRRSSSGQFSYFSGSPGHGRRCPYGKSRIGTIIDGDDISYMMDERAFLPQPLQRLSRFL